MPLNEQSKLDPLFSSISFSLETKLFSLRRIMHVDIVEQGSEEQGNKDMDAFSAVMDKVKSHPEVMEKVSAVMDKVKSHPEVVEKVKNEVKSLADALHLRRHGKTCIVSGDFIGDSCPSTA